MSRCNNPHSQKIQKIAKCYVKLLLKNTPCLLLKIDQTFHFGILFQISNFVRYPCGVFRRVPDGFPRVPGCDFLVFSCPAPSVRHPSSGRGSVRQVFASGHTCTTTPLQHPFASPPEGSRKCSMSYHHFYSCFTSRTRSS